MNNNTTEYFECSSAEYCNIVFSYKLATGASDLQLEAWDHLLELHQMVGEGVYFIGNN